jgi:hypothetical protein
MSLQCPFPNLATHEKILILVPGIMSKLEFLKAQLETISSNLNDQYTQ